MDQQTTAEWRDQLLGLDAADDPQAALQFLMDAAFRNPGDGELAFTVAARLRDQAQDREAAAVFALVSRTATESLRFRALVDRAACLVRLGDYGLAETDILAAIAIDPGSHWPVVAMGDLYAACGRVEDRLRFIEARYEGLRPDAKAEVVRYVAAVHAITHFSETRGRLGWSLKMPGSVAGLLRAGLIMMVKDECDVIEQNLGHHYALGFRAFCLIDNGSTDGTREKIDQFRKKHSDALVLYIHDPIVGYYQADKTSMFQEAFIRYARLDGIELAWMFFVDADEFISYAGPDHEAGVAWFNQVLGDERSAMIVFHWVHASTHDMVDRLPDDYDVFTMFGKMTSHLKPAVPKIGCSTALGLKQMMGNHFVESYEGDISAVQSAGANDWYMLHCPLRSADHTLKKVINCGQAFRNSKGLEAHGDHWKERFSLYEMHGKTIIYQLLKNHIDSIV